MLKETREDRSSSSTDIEPVARRRFQQWRLDIIMHQKTSFGCVRTVRANTFNSIFCSLQRVSSFSGESITWKSEALALTVHLEAIRTTVSALFLALSEFKLVHHTDIR
jgi:hypothetical protein